MSLTVLAIADQVHPSLYDHFEIERWKDVDLVLSAGDLPTEYLDFLCTCLGVPVFYVRGNHDGVFARAGYDGCENLHGRIVEYRGIRIAGFEGCVRYNDGLCQYSERQMGRIVKRSRLRAFTIGRPHIVVTHAPPTACHDGQDPCHRGFSCFRDIIEAWKPSYFIHGHTHRYYGGELVTHFGATTVVNAFPFHRFQIEEPCASNSLSTVDSSLRIAP